MSNLSLNGCDACGSRRPISHCSMMLAIEHPSGKKGWYRNGFGAGKKELALVNKMMHSVAKCSTMRQWIIMTSRNRITVNLSDGEHRELGTLSRKHRVSLAWLGRQAIIDFLAKHKDGGSFPVPTAYSGKGRTQRDHQRKVT